MKPKDVPTLIAFRPNPEDRVMISELSRLLKPRDMSKLIRKALECLLEKARAKH